MARMKRKQIYLEVDQDRRLRALARRHGKTESQLIRDGINRTLDDPTALGLNRKAWEEESAFIKALIQKGPIEGKRTWKREDLYDRR